MPSTRGTNDLLLPNEYQIRADSRIRTQQRGAKGKSTAPQVPDTLWLNTKSKDSLIGIRSRATPKEDFSHQLNLNDLLDAAIEMLPDDAYALLMLVEHDIYEDEDDEFACGRAYGGSRIAVVSSARYNPGLDAKQNIEREHAWPASHCNDYMTSCCNDFDGMDVDEEARGNIDHEVLLETLKMKKKTPIEAALAAHAGLPALSSSPSALALYDLWLGRVCRTAAHELGHCFGIGHCAYYACSMQGTASIVEDSRQPPYLCPIDLEKVISATGTDIVERYKVLLEFCDRHAEGHLFAAYAAWMRSRIKNLDDQEWPEVV
ncbi:hypothetical protein BJ875DRAFT_366458 [Amylocarpus encephaloides]|uniref:Uncharacterized protein n=1 Tax=Amylocarpus encephaloides TaxID=45428 RepID=A0A9P8CA20_9HELO|nr:hypothetical protein BJ875DRAFT_366458 [Amylocarpus encephaloides]